MIATRKVTVPSGTFQSGEIHAIVLRCGCGNPDSHSKLNLPCPTPRAEEDNGMIARVEADEIRPFEIERDPTIWELLTDLAHAVRQWFRTEWRNHEH